MNNFKIMNPEISEISALIKDKFPAFEPELIEYIAQNASIKTFNDGETIMRPGQYLKFTLLIIEGQIKLLTNGDDGEEFFLYYLEPGTACALSFVCAARNKTGDMEAIAVDNVKAIMIPIELMDDLMVKFKSWYYFVLDTYRSRFREMIETVKSVAFHAMDERLEFYLKKIQKAQQNDTIKVTHEQIANDLNSSRVVISRLLKQLENQKKVKLLRNEIEIRNL